jgi:hypothetical protein
MSSGLALVLRQLRTGRGEAQIWHSRTSLCNGTHTAHTAHTPHHTTPHTRHTHNVRTTQGDDERRAESKAQSEEGTDPGARRIGRRGLVWRSDCRPPGPGRPSRAPARTCPSLHTRHRPPPPASVSRQLQLDQDPNGGGRRYGPRADAAADIGARRRVLWLHNATHNTTRMSYVRSPSSTSASCVNQKRGVEGLCSESEMI